MEVAVAGVLQVIVHHRVVLLISYPVNDSNIPPSRLRTALCRNHQVLSFTMYHVHLTRKTTIRRYHSDHIHMSRLRACGPVIPGIPRLAGVNPARYASGRYGD